MRAILLAGGKGTRLRPLTLHTPKPVVPIFDRPFLRYQIDLLRQVPEIDDIVLSLNYQPEEIEEVFGDGSDLGIRLSYVVEPFPLGTGGAIRFAAGDYRDGPLVVFNGDVFTSVDLPAVIALHRERRARATIVLTPVDNPTAYGLVETDAHSNVRGFLEKPSADEITTNMINAGIYVLEPNTLDRIPANVVFSIERGYFPSLVENHETFVAYPYRGYWIDIGTPEKYRQAHRDIMDGHFVAPPFIGSAGRPVVSPDAHVEPGVTIEGPCFIDRAAVVRSGARIGPYTVIGCGCEIGADAQLAGTILWPHTKIGTGARIGGALIGRDAAIGSHVEIGDDVMIGDQSVVTDFSRTHVNIPASVFKAYDVRALYPSELDEAGARAIGRAFVAYLGASKIAVSRDMRLSSPTLATAFIDGAREQGADVVDYGMCATDMLYFGVVRDGLEGGAQITASHNPGAYNGIKMVRREAFPLSGDAGIGDIRDMVTKDAIPAPTRPEGLHLHASLIDDYIEKVMSFIDPSVIKPFNVVLDAGSGMAGLVAPRLFDRLPCKTTKLCFEIDGRFPNHEANPLIEENRADIVARVIKDKADIGIAWDGDADRCFFIDGTGEFIAGDFVTALLAEAGLSKTPGQKIIYDVRASYAVKDTVAKYQGVALMNRVGHAFIKGRMRQENALFGGEVTGHYYFRDFYYADNGFIPALLILELMSRRNMTLHELLAPLRAKYFISGEINTKVSNVDVVGARLKDLAEKYKDGHTYQLDGFSAEFPEWHFNVRGSNTEPLLRLNLEATTPALMEQKRDEVLAVIRKA